MSDFAVGILGGYGAVGSAATRLLTRWNAGCGILVGGRDGSRAKEFAAAVGHCEGTAVDLNGDSLNRFCAACRVVVNCAGPSYRVLDKVARAAVATGADYVDPGGDEPVYHRLQSAGTNGRTAVLNAGMMPGLTGLLPVWLARHGFDELSRLTAYVGTMDRLTPAGAADYLLSLGGGHGDPGAAWRDGTEIHRALLPMSEVDLPFFPSKVSAYPYLSRETARIACLLRIPYLDWYNVFDGGAHMMSALSRLQGAMAGHSDLAVAAQELTTAAALDLFGREPYQLMVIELQGRAGGEPLVKTLVLRARDTYQLTGFVTAFAAAAVLAGRVAPGVWFAAQTLEPTAVASGVRALAAVTELQIFDGDAKAASAPEEGVL